MVDAHPNPQPNTGPVRSPARSLSVWDAIAIIVGTIIGAGVFENAPLIARLAGSPAGLLALWSIGGLLALGGALCFAELTERYADRVGGDYWFLRDAFGPWVGFLFAWASFWIIRPGNIGLMALTFGRYASELWPLAEGRHQSSLAYALLAVALASVVNLRSLTLGKQVLNGLTLLKILGLAGLIALGLGAGTGDSAEAASRSATSPFRPEWGQALILVMFAYGGWNDLAFVAGEIKQPEKNLFRALVFGVLIVAVIYILLNASFERGLGYAALVQSEAIASDLIEGVMGSDSVWGTSAGKVVSLLVCLICLSAINAMVITSPRIYSAVGRDLPILSWLAPQGDGTREPRAPLILQAVLTAGLLVLVGFREEEPFQALINATTPVFFGFLALSFGSLIRLRRRQPDYRGFLAPAVPWLPLAMALISLAMVVSSLSYLWNGGRLVMLGVVAIILVTGLGCSWLGRHAHPPTN